jgi:hypothetical protein
MTGIRGLHIAAGLLAVAALCAQAQRPAAGGLLAEAVNARLAAIKQAAADNKAALSQYSWKEQVQVSLNGEVKANRQRSCRYGPDGKPRCTDADPPSGQEPSQRGLVGRLRAEKKEEFMDEIAQLRALIATYVPPDAAKMQAAHEAGNVSLSRPSGGGEAGLVFRNYSLPGDSLALEFSTARRKLSALDVNSFLDDASNAVTLNVQFASLPDGTNYPAHETINAAAKGLQLVISNSDYQKLAP